MPDISGRLPKRYSANKKTLNDWIGVLALSLVSAAQGLEFRFCMPT